MTREELRKRVLTLTDDQAYDLLMYLIEAQPVKVETAMRKAELL
jgi:hypothetical protein